MNWSFAQYEILKIGVFCLLKIIYSLKDQIPYFFVSIEMQDVIDRLIGERCTFSEFWDAWWRNFDLLGHTINAKVMIPFQHFNFSLSSSCDVRPDISSTLANFYAVTACVSWVFHPSFLSLDQWTIRSGCGMWPQERYAVVSRVMYIQLRHLYSPSTASVLRSHQSTTRPSCGVSKREGCFIESPWMKWCTDCLKHVPKYVELI